MKIKKYSLVILSISLILLVFVSSASAADGNGTDILSIDESTSMVNEKLALDYSSDTSGEFNDSNVIENDEEILHVANSDDDVLRGVTFSYNPNQICIGDTINFQYTLDWYYSERGDITIKLGDCSKYYTNRNSEDSISFTYVGTEIGQLKGEFNYEAKNPPKLGYKTTFQVTVMPPTIYVNSSAPHQGDGSIENPYRDMRTALDNARDGYTIKIASGEYKGKYKNIGLSINNKLNIIKYGDGEAIFDAEGLSRIWTVMAPSINITGITFKNGKADLLGGAIDFINPISNSNINATFINNTAKSGGGAFFFNGAVSNSTITGTYTNNTATKNGGTNYFNNPVSNSNITGTYTNNNARSGGTNFFLMAVSNSNISGTYTNNTATLEGGTNYFNKAVSNSNITGTYINNKATNGGTNYFSDAVSNSNITGTYTNNTATGNGGTNFFLMAVSNLDIGGIYINNTASNGEIICFRNNMGMLSAKITNSIFLNNKGKYEIYVRTSGVVVEDSWFGNNANNYMNKPNKIYNVEMNNWLFLNATADYNSLLIMNPTNITFKLYSTNGTNVSDFDNSLLPVVNLSLTATNGDIDMTTITLDNVVKYTAKERGIGSVTASIENAKYTIFLDSRFDPEFSAVIKPQEIYYGENTTVSLSYNDTATGTVNIILTGKKHSQTIENVDLNKTIRLPTTILPDEYEVTVIYSGDKLFSNASATSTLTVKQLKSDIKVVGHDIYVNETRGLMFNVTLPGNATGNLNISNGTILNVTKEGRKENNSLIIEIMNNAYPIGKYEWTFTYLGDDIYENSEKTAVANILIIPTAITANATSKLFVDNTTQVSYNLTPDDAVGDIIFTSNDTSVVEVNKNGNIKAIAEGTALITVTFEGSENYTASSTNITITVSKIPTEINITNETVELKALQSIGGLATLNPAGAGNLTYTSSDENIVEVSDDGFIYARIKGTATVTVSFTGDDKYKAAESKNITVTVTLNDARVSVENDTLDLFVDDTCIINATSNPSFLTVYYTSSDESVATVTDYGNVKAVGEGTAVITLTVGNDETYVINYTYVKVTVRKIPTEILITNETLDLKVSDEVDSGAGLNPSEAGNLTYTISETSIIKLLDNQIIALSEGSAAITYSFAGNDKYAAAQNKTITVKVSLNDASVSVNNNTLNLFVDDTFTIVANTTPKGLKVTYKPDNSGIISVDGNGVVKALKEGNTIIIVSVGDNKVYAENTTTVTVTVRKIPTEITVNPASLDLFVGDETVINANLTPLGAGNVTFTSSDDSIVTVDNQGNVIAQGKGTAIITVSFAGDNKYAAAENKTITVNVSLNDARVTVDNDTLDLKVDETYKINATKHPDTIMLDITYKSSDNSVASVDKNGIVTAISEGTAIITLEVGDGEIYAKNSTTVTVTVKKVNPTMDASADEITEGENATINIELPIDATGNVTTAVNGKNYSSPVDNGKAIITISGLEYGNYTLPVTYSGDDKYNSLTKDVNLTVKEDEIVVSAPDLTKYYSGNERFNVNVAYANGRAIAGKEVKITINGVTYKRTTDENGSALLNINLNSATYGTVVEVDNIAVNSLVTILPTIEAEDVESKSKNIVFSATFIDGEGNYLKEGTDVSFNIGGVIYNSQVTGDKGRASVDLVLNHGRYIITLYNSVSNENISNTIAIDLKDARMILSGDEISVGDNATISVTLPSDATGNVTATINGKTYTNQVNNGKTNIIIPDLSAGNYTAHVTYLGDNNYNHATGNASISVSKVDAIIDIEDSVITVGENATIMVILPSDATGNVRIGNEIVPLKEGTASAILTGLPVGITTIPVTYSGDDKYNPIETNADVVVNDVPSPDKKNLTIKATSDEITEGEDAVIIVTGLENATGNVSAVVHGHVHSAPIIDGTANITIKGLVENATAFVSYAGDDLYNSAVTTVNITVNKNTVNINAGNLTKYYKDPQKFTVTVTDAKGQAVTNKTVEITINGVTYTRTTDENGTASLNINLNSGEYPVSVAVDDVVVNSSVFVKATIDASDVVKVFRNDTQYYATFVDVNGTPTPNTVVSFNVNGVIYNRATDENGTAKLNINLPSGEYILTATNTVTGEKISNVIKVLSVIESSDLTKYFRNASQFIVRIHTADGGYVGAGEEVRFNINGMIYAKKTNATGHAKININLPQGLYTITTYYKDFSQGNSIEVLPILSAEDLSMKYMDGSQFKAQLVDGQGKPYPKQDVRFNINGVFYNRATDSDGVAKLNIRLLSGQYIITSGYNGCNIANKITIRG